MANRATRHAAAHPVPGTWTPQPDHAYAVVTGDIVASSRLAAPARRRLPALLASIGTAAGKFFGAALPLQPIVFSGDSWQALVARPEHALHVALFYRAALRAESAGLDTRLAIGIGAIAFVPGGDISQADGEAFRLSGRTLADMSDAAMRLAAAAPFAGRQPAWDIAIRLLDGLIALTWTPPRARAVCGALRGWPQARIARLWKRPIRQSSVSQNLRDAQWPLAEATLAAFAQDWSHL